jgi:hypothetical protein
MEESADIASQDTISPSYSLNTLFFCYYFYWWLLVVAVIGFVSTMINRPRSQVFGTLANM